MVLAAGLGTRLRPLTDVRAKPLVPIGDRPALAHVVDRLRLAGLDRIVVNAHHRAGDIRAFARTLPFEIDVSEECDLLGTAGGIAFARDLLGEGDVLVWNGDILANVDVADVTAKHGADATLVVQPLARGQGLVGLDDAGHVVRLRQERFAEETRGGTFLGISVLSEGLRAHLPAVGGLIEDVLVPAMRRGAVVRSYPFAGAWRDIGTVASYLAANEDWLDARSLSAWVGPGARVADGVTLEGSIVGEGATVTGQGSLVGCVVWPGAIAVAPGRQGVVT